MSISGLQCSVQNIYYLFRENVGLFSKLEMCGKSYTVKYEIFLWKKYFFLQIYIECYLFIVYKINL